MGDQQYQWEQAYFGSSKSTLEALSMPFIHINSAALVMQLLLSLLQVLGEQGGTWCFLEQVVSAAIHLPGALSSVGRAREVSALDGAVQPASPPWAAGHEPCPGAACGAGAGTG